MAARNRTRFEDMDKDSLSIENLVDQFLVNCQVEGRTPATIRGYREKLGRFVRLHGGTLGEFSLSSARGFVAELQTLEKWRELPAIKRRGEPLAASTVSGHVRPLKSFASWLYREEYTATNLLTRLRPPKAPVKVIEILSEKEVEGLLAAIDRNAEMGARDLALVVLMLDTGLRLSELTSLALENLHLQEQWLKVMGKGQKERMIPFGLRSAQLLNRYLRTGRYNPLGRAELFLTAVGDPMSHNSLRMLFLRLRKRTGIKRLHPHLLRHTFATSYLVAGGDVFSLQSILGHTSLEMTRRYVALAATLVQVQHRRFSPMDRIAAPSLRTRPSRAERDAFQIANANVDSARHGGNRRMRAG